MRFDSEAGVHNMCQVQNYLSSVKKNEYSLISLIYVDSFSFIKNVYIG